MRNIRSVRALAVKVSLAEVVAASVGLGVGTGHATETTNRLSGNRLAGNKLCSTRLEANSETADILNTADSREVYSYMVSCGLPERTTIEATVADAPDTAPRDTLYTCSNERCSFPGSLGLAELWIDRSLDPIGQRWVVLLLRWDLLRRQVLPHRLMTTV